MGNYLYTEQESLDSIREALSEMLAPLHSIARSLENIAYPPKMVPPVSNETEGLAYPVQITGPNPSRLICSICGADWTPGHWIKAHSADELDSHAAVPLEVTDA